MLFPRHVTRRDFLNGVLVAAGGMLLGCRPDRRSSAAGAADTSETVFHDWHGYGGVGDYRLSHGNTPGAVATAHRLREEDSVPSFEQVEDVESFDLVIVGAGMAGLGAAFEFAKRTQGKRCLILDNHPIFGGEAKENEFLVDGHRLIAPQGANGFFVPPPVADIESASGDPRWYAELDIPREFRFAAWPGNEKPLGFSPDNYEYLVRGLERHTSVGHFFRQPSTNAGEWAIDIWKHRLANTPLSQRVRETLLAWHDAGASQRFANVAEAMRTLDSMSYEEYLSTHLGLGAEAARHADLFLASACGLGSDAVSAWAAANLPMPGVMDPLPDGLRRVSFPGGNSGFARCLVKRLIPDAIGGSADFADIITGRIDFAALDRPGRPIRMRLDATALRVEHDGNASRAGAVQLIYGRGQRLHRVRAAAVVMASGGWMNRHVVRDLPAAHRDAYARFVHAPFLVVNVALTNWRFLHRLGATAAVWDRDDEGFGFTCNLRNPMQVGSYQPPLDPDLPAVLTFYTPFHRPGLPIQEQVTRGREELLRTSWSAYERRILHQMQVLFAATGFDPRRDVSGIILNRWGHAYSVPFPGFFGGASGHAPRDVIRQSYGRIAFAHSELDGLQHWGPAADEGRRAFEQLAGAL